MSYLSKLKQCALGIVITSCTFAVSIAQAAVKEYHLEIAENTVNITGKNLKRITVNGQFPAPQLQFEEGDDAVIHVHNSLKNQDSSIHWHGLLLPGMMDGVPGFNGFKGIQPQQNFSYRFKVRQSGTYWYHAHSMGQEQDGLYGALVIHPKAQTVQTPAGKAERDYVVMLSDFHTSKSAQILANLKKDSEYYQNKRETLFDVLKQTKKMGIKATWQDRNMWNQMRMLKTDLSDVTGYTYLVNGKTPQQNWTGLFQSEEKIRLRFINASAMTFYDVRIPDLKMTVVAADGQPVQPVVVDEFRIGNAETYDVIVEPDSTQTSYQIQAEAIDRSGFAIGTLQHQAQPQQNYVQMPQARPRAILNMADMGHGADGDSDDAHQQHTQQSAMKMEGGNHHPSHMQEQMVDDKTDLLKTEPLVNIHIANDHSSQHQQMHQHHSMAQIESLSMEMKDHSMLQHGTVPEASSNTTSHIDHQMLSSPIKQATKTVEGWANASTPLGMKALQYSDLKSLKTQPDVRPATRDLVIRLGGNMERYIWTINAKKFTEAEPLKVHFGERVRLIFINDSMMAHPMHLHGMFMQLENGQALQDLPNKHTLIVPPGKTVSALLTADELGEWAIHCHLLYHMSSGMMSKLVVANVDPMATTKAHISSPKAQNLDKHQQRSTQPSNEGASHDHH
ncbi:copper resistance system multicopper oxidase [Acinetobacter lanii]|uniref:Copper resistance system multicopper oxidase n=1 Tax=Acinetobacter lanii TaxID=2715163 RepID=A0A6G8S680_9GAMM|nr:copper resistance system multicopper oxidase [Acinetobacter lanii]QIO09657.1 copper resistance system multicopper oxidase [Acinetobacter lanii]